MLFVYYACLVVAGFAGMWLLARARHESPTNRVIRGTLPVLLVLVTTSPLQAILDAPYRSVWNPVRLTPTLSLALGHTLYCGPDDGPVTGHIYGPVAAIAYIPAVFGRSPTDVLHLGTMISLCIYFAPLIWLAFKLRDPTANWATVRAECYVFALFPLLTFLRPQTLGYVSSLVHADGPAVALGGAAVAYLYVDPTARWPALARSALFAVLAVWAKQVMLPLLFILPLWLWWANGFRSALAYVVCLTGIGFTAAVAALAFFDPRALWFNLVTIPSRHPWDVSKWGDFPGNLINVTAEWWEFAALMLVLLGIGCIINFVAAGDSKQERPRWTVFIVASLALLPTSLLGRLKVGGDYNALSFTLYFLLFALCLLLRDQVIVGRRWLAIIAVSGAAVLLFRAQQERFELLEQPQICVDEIVYKYITDHPDEAYFPWNPMTHLMAEDMLYHFDYGAFDRELAGFPLSPEHVRRHMPSNPRLICFPPKANMHYLMKYFPEFSRRVDVPELPGFDCYEREQAGP